MSWGLEWSATDELVTDTCAPVFGLCCFLLWGVELSKNLVKGESLEVLGINNEVLSSFAKDDEEQGRLSSIGALQGLQGFEADSHCFGGLSERFSAVAKLSTGLVVSTY